MRHTIFISTAVLLMAFALPALASEPLKPAVKGAPERPTVTVHAVASVSDTYFTLGEIADIKGAAPDILAKLSAAPMGRAPLPGQTRPLNTGDICLKLRQVGIDPATISLAGAATVQITGLDGSQGSQPASGQAAPSAGSGMAATSAPAQARAVLVHSGDAVNLIYSDGRITITARAYALQNGAAGDTISLRRDGATHTFEGTVLDSQTVQLED